MSLCRGPILIVELQAGNTGWTQCPAASALPWPTSLCQFGAGLALKKSAKMSGTISETLLAFVGTNFPVESSWFFYVLKLQVRDYSTCPPLVGSAVYL